MTHEQPGGDVEMATAVDAPAGEAESEHARPRSADRLRRNAVQVVALTLLLATVLEVLLALAAFLIGEAGEGVRPFLLEWVQRLPWALIVCVGIWVGLTTGQGRLVPLALAGLLAAPVASLVARMAALGLEAAFVNPPAGPSPLAIAALRALEYMSVALAVGWLSHGPHPRPQLHAVAGFMIGALFGLALLALTTLSGGSLEISLAFVAAWIVNELLFPAGCALILSRVARTQARPISV